jgi:hypothetical protein
MKVCAITMVYKDYWALSKWYAHYSKAIGSENLFIIAHGYDPKVAELCPTANVITVPRDTLAGFDRMRGHMLNSIQDGLGIAYDWVIRTDADELITLDPAHYGSFADLLGQHSDQTSLFALGLNMAERNEAVFSGHYSKAWAVKRGTHMARHGIALQRDAAFTLPRGVYLAHLKFANAEALADANAHRADIASGSEPGLPGRAWVEAERTAKRFYDRLAAMPVSTWEAASSDAYTKVTAEPVMDEKPKVLRARSINFDTKTVLPDWFTR